MSDTEALQDLKKPLSLFYEPVFKYLFNAPLNLPGLFIQVKFYQFVPWAG